MLRTLRRRFFENPLIGRELATGLTSPRLGAVFTFVGGVYLLVDLLCYLFFWELSSFGAPKIEAGAILHGCHSGLGYLALSFLLPLRLSGHIEGARAGRAFDQVVVTGVSPVRMHLGNWTLGLCYAGLLLLVTLPYEVMAYVFGGIRIGEILASYGVLLLYSNVIIGMTLGFSVVTSEWLVVPLTVFLLIVAGIVSSVPYTPPVIAEIAPLRFISRQAMSTSLLAEGMPSDAVEVLQGVPRFFFLDVPVGIYTPLLWTSLLVPFVMLIVLGPSHFFIPGFNVFGNVVLPGDSKRSRFRRLRHGLVRRIEMAFYYENRPAWCDRWDFPLRTFVGVLVVVLLWGAVFGIAYATVPSPRTLGNDTAFHASFVISSLILFFWMLATGQTRLWVLFREKVGRLEFTRGAILHLSFFVLFAALFLAQYMAFQLVEEGRPLDKLSPGRALQVETYRTYWYAYVGVCLVLFLNIYLLSRVLAWVFQNPSTWRVWVFLATNVLLWGPIAVYEIASRNLFDILPPSFARLVFLSPYAIVELREAVALDERLRNCVIAHACLGTFLFVVLFVLTRWLWEDARWPSLRARRPGRPRRTVAALLLLSGLAALSSRGVNAQIAPGNPVVQVVEDDGSGGFAEFEESGGWSSEGDLPLEVVEVIRGFDGRTFSAQVDFLTIVLHNPGAEALTGRLRARASRRGWRYSAWQPFEVPTRTRVPVRMSFSPRLYWSSLELAVELEADGRRLVVEGIAPIVDVGQTSLPSRLEEGGRFLIVTDSPGRPVDWERATTGGAVVHIVCRPFCLPEDYGGYENTSTVFLGTPDFSRWTSRQRRALYDYVRLGGALVLFGEVFSGGREGIEPWGRWFDGARVRRIEGPGGRYGLVEFAESETLLYLESGTAGEPVPLLSVRSVGPGRLGHLAFDPTAPRLPTAVASSSKFWAEFTRTVPKSLHPVVFGGIDPRDRHLNDSTSLYLILGYFALYTLLLGPGLFFWFRQKARRPWMWGYALSLCGLFAVGVYALDWVVHTHPSHGEIREMIYFGPRSQQGVCYATVRLRSCGRQRHLLRVGGDRVSSFNVFREYWGSPDIPFEWRHDPVPDDAHRELPVTLAPWSALPLSLLGETDFRSGVSGKATYEKGRQRLHYTVQSTAETANTWFVLLTYNLKGQGRLWSHVVRGGDGSGGFGGTVSPEGGDSRAVSRFGGVSDTRSFARVFKQSWGSALSVNGASTPRVMVAWSPAKIQPGLDLSSDDVLFRRENTVDSNGRPYREFREFRQIEGDGGPYHLLHQQLIVQEIPLEVK